MDDSGREVLSTNRTVPTRSGSGPLFPCAPATSSWAPPGDVVTDEGRRGVRPARILSARCGLTGAAGGLAGAWRTGTLVLSFSTTGCCPSALPLNNHRLAKVKSKDFIFAFISTSSLQRDQHENQPFAFFQAGHRLADDRALRLRRSP